MCPDGFPCCMSPKNINKAASSNEMPVVQIQYIGRFFCPKWVQVFNILLRYTWACGHEKSGIYTHPKIIDQPTLSTQKLEVNSVGDRLVSPVAGTDICGSVVFINGGSDTQWVAPSLALVRSLSSLISLSLVSRHYAALRPPAVIYNNIRRPRV